MKQYLELLSTIKQKGTYKPAARENMPGTQSLFGYQFRHDLQDGFPLLTTKKVYWKGVVVELLWFLRGDTNIKYLVNNGVNIWNEDAYNYYKKKCKDEKLVDNILDFDGFVHTIKVWQPHAKEEALFAYPKSNYRLGDCGYQYGKVWRNWEGNERTGNETSHGAIEAIPFKIDQIKNLINSLKNNPESRRHIVTAIDPAHDTDLALYWCHAMFQFNCRPITYYNTSRELEQYDLKGSEVEVKVKELNLPKYYLDCQLYQRSADVVLGVPFNIASYALLTHILAKICNMIPGEFVHTFGDVHIYDNHKNAVEEQLQREPAKLPTLNINDLLAWDNQSSIFNFDHLAISDFTLENYNPQPAIKAELSTGLKK